MHRCGVLRNTACAGVRCGDNGPKQGLLGVDNGQIWLHSARVPRDALLDRYAQVGGGKRGTGMGVGVATSAILLD